MSASVPGAGDVIAGRFVVEAEIGRGGMGVVLRGRAPDQRAVAIKVLLPEAIAHPEAVPRFVNEAKAARELTSEHSVRVLEAGTLEMGLPFMVMELLEGSDLGSILEKRGRFGVTETCDAIIDASHALAEAHARGMVHRDIKPSNLFAIRGPDGGPYVKVLDFGVSKVAATARHASLTSTGTMLGSPHYMAPEQLRSAKGVDARADIWSLGVVLYELLAGRAPFDGRSFGALFMQIVSEEPRPIAQIRPDVPAAMVAIVETCMKKERDQRYPDLPALVAALSRFASPRGAALAARIAAESAARGGVPPPPASDPMPPSSASAAPKKPALGGTMLMANAPRLSGLGPPAGHPSSGRMLAAPASVSGHPGAAAMSAPPGAASSGHPIAASSGHPIAASSGHLVAAGQPIANAAASSGQLPAFQPTPAAAPAARPPIALVIGAVVLFFVIAVGVVFVLRR